MGRWRCLPVVVFLLALSVEGALPPSTGVTVRGGAAVDDKAAAVDAVRASGDKQTGAAVGPSTPQTDAAAGFARTDTAAGSAHTNAAESTPQTAATAPAKAPAAGPAGQALQIASGETAVTAAAASAESGPDAKGQTINTLVSEVDTLQNEVRQLLATIATQGDTLAVQEQRLNLLEHHQPTPKLASAALATADESGGITGESNTTGTNSTADLNTPFNPFGAGLPNASCAIRDVWRYYRVGWIGIGLSTVKEDMLCPGMEDQDQTPRLKQCPTDCQCYESCASGCSSFPITAVDSSICFNATMFKMEAAYCKGTFNEAQQTMMMLQGWIALLQSMHMILVTRYKAFMVPNAPFRILISEQVLRSNFVLMGITGGTIGVVRSNYFYSMYGCDQLHMPSRASARFNQSQPILIALGFITLLLFGDRSLQELIMKQSNNVEFQKAVYKIDRRLASEQWVDRSGMSELQLWNDVFDRITFSREYIDASTKAYLFTYTGRASFNFQLFDAYAIICGAFLIMHLFYQSHSKPYLGGRCRDGGDPTLCDNIWYIWKRHVLAQVMLGAFILVFAGMIYCLNIVLTTGGPKTLQKHFQETCGEHLPDANAKKIIDDIKGKKTHSAEHEAGASAAALEEDEPSDDETAQLETQALSVLGGDVSLLQTATSVMGAKATSSYPDLTGTSPQYFAQGQKGSKNFCLKWRLCMEEEGKDLRSTYMEWSSKKPDEHLERYAACWMFAQLNPHPEQMWHVPLEPPKAFS